MVSERSHYSQQAYYLLKLVFIVAPILAGIDKFTGFLTHWENYLSPFVHQTFGMERMAFMKIIGIVEILVGVGILWKAKVFAYIVTIWLVAIIVNLLMLGQFLDVALRDLGLALSALALARLSHAYEH
ncbi:MAG: hypothetical protein L0207_05190 [Chlamydiae bacterium]|nr:hypothetical protein [Chlamydiota bacterium]